MIDEYHLNDQLLHGCTLIYTNALDGTLESFNTLGRLPSFVVQYQNCNVALSVDVLRNGDVKTNYYPRGAAAVRKIAEGVFTPQEVNETAYYLYDLLDCEKKFNVMLERIPVTDIPKSEAYGTSC